ncbi:oligosaccharide flippase family protein [Escherichia coli]|uniref:oligosaccharide flippase family protein n=1 Tax=Escherichia coli TaxID=562 RepID=UPI00311AF4AF|nr:oligosaccharide flippase family protein [Escherichia coli]HBN1674260.1 oligosaccharide flippase family protein [Escherichia coli]
MKLNNIKKVIPLYFSQALSAALPLILSPAIIKHSGIEFFGLYSGMIVISQLALMVSEYSFEFLAPRKVGDSSNINTKIYNDVIVAKLLMSLVGLIFSFILIKLMLEVQPTLFDMISIFVVMLAQSINAPWFMLALGRVKELAILISLARILTLSLSLVYLIADENADYKVLFFLYSFPLLATSFYFHRDKLKKVTQTSISDSFSLIKEGKVVFFANIASVGQNFIAPVFIGVIGTSTDLGVYNAIDRLARFLSASLKPILQYTYPRSIAMFRQSFKIGHRNVLKLTCLFVSVSVFFFLSSVFFGKPVLNIIYNSELSSYNNLLNILILWLSVGLYNNAIGIQGLLALGRDKIYSCSIWFALFTTTLLIILLNNSYDVIYLAGISILVGEMVSSLWLTLNYLKILRSN